MTTAFVSLHTQKPQSQLDHEVFYKGYARLPVEFTENFGEKPLNLIFPVIESDSDDVVTYISVGACESGQGDIFMRVPCLPNIPLLAEVERRMPEWWMRHGLDRDAAEKMVAEHGLVAPRICLCNSAPVNLPENLNPIARTAHQLIYAGMMTAAELHPKLFEAINDALQNAGVPPLTVVRSGAAQMKGEISKLNFQEWGNA